MSQLTIQTQTVGGAAGNRARRRPMRTERMVGLRSAMPLGLVTLRHDVPQRINHDDITPEKFTTATPKVDPAGRVERSVAETPARKGGEAQW